MSSNLTVEEARDEVHRIFKTAWDAGVESAGLQVLYWNSKQPVPEANDANNNPNSWARITVRHVDSNQSALTGSTGLTPFTRIGLVTVQVFTPLGTGLSIGDSLYKIVLDAYEGIKSPLGVWFRNVRLQEIGESRGWFQANILAEFQYDEIK